MHQNELKFVDQRFFQTLTNLITTKNNPGIFLKKKKRKKKKLLKNTSNI